MPTDDELGLHAMSPLTEFADVITTRLHTADDNVITWLKDLAMKALAK